MPTSKKLVSDSSLKAILDSNSMLKDFMIQNNLSCEAGENRLKFFCNVDEANCEPLVTIWWSTNKFKKFDIKLFRSKKKNFPKECRVATALIAKSIMALYLAVGVETLTNKHIQLGYQDLKSPNIESKAVVPKALITALTSGEISKKLIDNVFFFKRNMLPSQIVSGAVCDNWKLPKQFDRLADLSFVWLRNKWVSWCNCFQFHEAAPCGIGIYDTFAAESPFEKLKYDIDDRKVIVAMHDAIYPVEANRLKNDDILRAVGKDKFQFEMLFETKKQLKQKASIKLDPELHPNGHSMKGNEDSLKDSDQSDLYCEGLRTRRLVLGDQHVDRAIAATNEYDAGFQQLITEAAWGRVWSRPNLSRRDRSLLTIALLAALGHDEEVEMHLRASTRTGASKEEIVESLLHVAIYAGVPAANRAFRIAKRVFSELDSKGCRNGDSN